MAGASLGAAVLLMAALFLAHGLQCAAASDHGRVALSHSLVMPVAADDLIHEGADGHESELTVLGLALAYPVSDSDALGRASVVCVAAFTAVGLWFLSARRVAPTSRRQSASLWPGRGPTARKSDTARWRPQPFDLALLCVLRT